MGDEEIDTMRALAALELPCRLTAWCRATPGDIDLAEQCEVDVVHFSLPVSMIQLRALGKTKSWVIAQLKQIAQYARERFRFVSVGAQDASRADPHFLVHCARVARAAGVDRFRVADTVGVWNPLQTFRVMSSLRAGLPDLPLGFHGHNDLGMATANTLAALEAGRKVRTSR